MSEKKKLSRRDFLRLAGLGLGGTAVSTAANPHSLLSAPSSGDFVDEAGRPKRPLWIKTVDEPTIEIDWDRMERYNERTRSIRGPGFANYVGKEEAERLDALEEKNIKQKILDEVPGYTLKDRAIENANLYDLMTPHSFLGPQMAPTPEDRGVPKWEGSPEEAARIIRVAMRHFGAAHVGFVELNENTRKLIYSHDPDGKKLVFEDAEEAYEIDEKRVIPYKAKWVIVYTVRQSTETLSRAPTATGEQTTLLSYGRGGHIQNQTQEFLRGLGYQALGESSVNALGIANGFAVLAGLGEMGRMNRLVTPEFGPMVRVFKLVTDLPVATDKPIDAGIMEFCKSCKKCAEACPSGALSFKDGPTWETQGEWNNPGHKTWYEDAVKCYTYWKEGPGTGCSICFSVCPFTKHDKAWIHDWVKGGIAAAPVLNSFFRSMDDAFGYGAQKDPELWWHLDLPEYGIDTGRTVEDM